MSTNTSAAKKIPVCRPFLNGNEKDYLLDAVTSTWISSRGSYLDRFEREFPAYIGVKYGTATPNGTVALHLALRALGIGPGDEVILPTFTMVASAFAICYCGATPVLLDADPDDWNLNVELLRSAVSSRTKAIMVVHIYGHPTNMDPVMDFAREHGLVVIEDAAEAHGSECLGRRCGSMSQVACFSFFANKNITCGEGGMVITDDENLYDRLRYYKNLCFPLGDARNYDHRDIGFNYRMSNLHAALGCAQLEKIDEYVAMRRRNAELYRVRLSSVPGLRLPIERPWAKNTYWMYGVLCEKDFGSTRDNLISRLAQEGIETRAFFKPMHLQKAVADYGFRAPRQMPVAEVLGIQGLYLPSSSNLTIEEIEHVSGCLADIQRQG
jgi:perosamine synthetase